MGVPHNFSDDNNAFPGPSQQSNTATTVIIVIAAIGGVFLLICGGLVGLVVFATQRAAVEFDNMMAEVESDASWDLQSMQDFQTASNIGDYQSALDAVEEQLAVDEENETAHNNKAWLLATCPDEQFRDGALAVEHATKACELTDWENAGFVDTLAAAYAESGDFESAAEWQQRAIDIDSSGSYTEQFSKRLVQYENKEPYREGPLPEGQFEIQPESTDEVVEPAFQDASDENKSE